MADDAQSGQEQGMKTICGRLMAAPFVFCPELWRVAPNKMREPADLIWACNNCIILMYLIESKLYGNAEKNKRKFADGADHNLGQAKGAIKIWKEMPIVGQNDWHRFSLARDDRTHVVVLSVVKTGSGIFSGKERHSYIEYHPAWAKERGITLCATVPQFFVDMLAGDGASALDLLVLLAANHRAQIISETTVIDMVRDYRSRCRKIIDDLKLAEYDLPEFDDQSAGLFSSIFLCLCKTRHRPTGMRGNGAPLTTSANIGAKYGVLSDMNLAEFGCLGKVIAACIRQMQVSGNRVHRNISLNHYDCRICAVPAVSDEDFCKEDFNVWAAPRKQCVLRPGLYFRYNWGMGELGCWPVSRFGPSHAERVLNTVER